ncbi:phosphatase PAP2 family protein [Caenimonas terrae]|uniref:Phosphatase PAP2 family protein n=1 Tax=Caenimonas terrae TaxID=696074 RepID=A0ABW0NA89_9BURK
MTRHLRATAAALVACVLSGAACAAGGPLGIDHRLALDESGIWARRNQRAVYDLSALTVLGGALWEGSDSRLGKTFWKSAESMALADIAATGLKAVTRRARPSQGNDPNDWWGSASNRSFPSNEVAHISAIVTPFIAEYAPDHPAVWGLAALPMYVGIARMKSQAHWQTDVLAGAALGAGIGYYEYSRQSAWSATVLPHGLTIGFRRRF